MSAPTSMQTAFERSREYQTLSRGFLRETGDNPTLGAAAPPYETQYGDPNLYQQSEELADIAGFYRACGLNAPATERVDHLAVELEFMSFLTLQEAWAHFQDPDQVDSIRKMQSKFLADHLGRWAPAFAAKFVSSDAGLCSRLREWIDGEGKLLGVVPAPVRDLDLRTAEDANEPFECGGATCPIA